MSHNRDVNLQTRRNDGPRVGRNHLSSSNRNTGLSLGGYWSRWYPHGIAAVAIPIVYFATNFFFGQRLLAAVSAIATYLAVLTALKVWQSKGQLSLATTAFLLPLLTALVCLSLSSLTPLAVRQRTISKLRDTNLTMAVKLPIRNGEWIHNEEGFMFPIWFGKLFGPDCMTEVRKLGGKLADLQRFEYQSIPASSLIELRLTRQQATPPLEEELVEWLAKYAHVELDLELQHVLPKEVIRLERLPPPLLHEVVLGFDGAIPVMHLPGQPISLSVSGKSISPGAIVALLENRHERVLTQIRVEEISPVSIEAIQNAQILLWSGVRWDVEDLRAYATQRIEHTGFLEAHFPAADEIREVAVSLKRGSLDEESARIQSLSVYQSGVRFDQLLALVECLGCKELSTDLVLTQSNLTTLWKIRGLEQIDYAQRTGGVFYRVVQRRGAEPDSRHPVVYPARDPSTGTSF